MSNFLDQIIQKFDSKAVRWVKNIVLGVFIILIVLDIIFVAVDGIPTISMVVHDSSPKYMVLIFLFGLFATNVLFQQTVQRNKNTQGNFIVLVLVSIFLMVAGFLIEQPTQITCENYSAEIAKVEIPYLTQVKCHDYTNGVSAYQNFDCSQMNCNENVRFKLDITVGVKLFLLLLGMALGYWLWPSYEDSRNTK